jgi:membrane-bound lytic murein transglycosylase B
MRILCFLLLLLSTPVLANDEPFGMWLMKFQEDALAQGISKDTLEKAFAETKPIPDIIRLDRKQPEGTKTLPEYMENVITQKRIDEGKRLLAENKELLTAIENKYGVDKEVIVALWGIETSYGKNTGNYSVVDALATLAYDGRRSAFFRNELINALKIIDADHISAEEMDGSWAGAMGQCQFMPTSFLKYAVDYDGDGKRDIWNTQEDVFASIAHYLQSEGWKPQGEMAMPALLPEHFDKKFTDIKTTKPVSEWKRLGVTYIDGSPLADNGSAASVIMVGKDADMVPYIVYDNYKVILKWNKSRYFATAVDMLSEELR